MAESRPQVFLLEGNGSRLRRGNVPVNLFRAILAQARERWRIGVAVNLESALESSVHCMSGRSAAW